MKLSTQAEIAILSSFNDKGIKKAQSSMGSFEKFATSAAKKLAALFTVDKVLTFTADSVKASQI